MLLTESDREFLNRALGPEIPKEILADFKRVCSVDMDARSPHFNDGHVASDMLVRHASAKGGVVGWSLECHSVAHAFSLHAYAHRDGPQVGTLNNA
jgi:hypothetical protein